MKLKLNELQAARQSARDNGDVILAEALDLVISASIGADGSRIYCEHTLLSTLEDKYAQPMIIEATSKARACSLLNSAGYSWFGNRPAHGNQAEIWHNERSNVSVRLFQCGGYWQTEAV